MSYRTIDTTLEDREVRFDADDGELEVSDRNSASFAFLTKDGARYLRSALNDYLGEDGEAAPKTPVPTTKAPNGPQRYRGNGCHGWEPVTDSLTSYEGDATKRLRVPGGWIYLTNGMPVYVPVPDAVGYKV